MDITTKDNIKRLISKEGTEDDKLLIQIASSVSNRLEEYMGRELLIALRTEFFDIEQGQNLFLPLAFPITAADVFNDFDRNFAASSEIDNNLYTFLGEWGELIIDQFTLDIGAKRLKVTYTGGLATDQADLESKFPDIEMAARIQGAFLYEKRQKLGIGAEAFEGGSMRFQSQLKLLPDVTEAIDKYRRLTLG